VKRGEINWELSDLIDRQGGFSTSLSFSDRLKLRAIVRKVHLRYYPGSEIDDRLCDSLIDVFAPETSAYLIRQALEKGTH
jgi:hypothetical protein